MVSEANPYLWSTAAAVFLGLAVGQGIKSLLSGRESPIVLERRRPRRAARAMSFLSLSILAIVGLLVFTKVARTNVTGAGVASAGASAADGALIVWAVMTAVLAALVGLRPLAFGAPIALLAAAVLVVFCLTIQDWLPLDPNFGLSFRSGPGPVPNFGSRPDPSVEIARLLPYEVGLASFRGQLESVGRPKRTGRTDARRGATGSLEEASLASSSVGLCAETLELHGPLGFLAALMQPQFRPASPASTSRLNLYRVIGLVAPGGLLQPNAALERLGLIRTLIPLPSLGFDPGGKAVARRAFFGLALRRRIPSPSVELVALQPVHFDMAVDGSTLTVR